MSAVALAWLEAGALAKPHSRNRVGEAKVVDGGVAEAQQTAADLVASAMRGAAGVPADNGVGPAMYPLGPVQDRMATLPPTTPQSSPA